MKVGIIYTKFFPLGSSASVHGYYLFKNLKDNGVILHSYGLGKNDLTIDYPKGFIGLIKFIFSIDVIYIRINPWLWNDWFTLVSLFTFGKVKVFWEVNAPIEEVLISYPNGFSWKMSLWYKFQQRKRRLLAKLVSGAITVSDILKDYVEKDLSIKNVISIPNGSDPDLFRRNYSVENSLDLFPGKFKVVWAGNSLIKWQGTNLILEAAEKMKSIDPEVLFILFGNKSMYDQKLLSNVLSFGEVRYDVLPSFLSKSDVGLCLYNSYDWCRYGFYNSPLKLFDYLSSGLIVIGSNMGQISQIVEDGVNGFLFDGEPDDLVELILKIKSMKEEILEPIRANARKVILDEHSWQNVALKTLQFINTNK